MEEILFEIAKQSPTIGILGYWVYSLQGEKKALTLRSDKKEDDKDKDDKLLWERVLTTMTNVVAHLESAKSDHADLKKDIAQMKLDIELIKSKLA